MKSYRIAIAFVLIVILAAHVVVGEPYLWYRHSISQLAGQAYEHAWIMRIGFIGFGVLVLIAGIGRMRATGRHWYRELPILFYGVSILASGIFSTTPFVEGVPYSEQEAQLHTLFATAAGWALTAGTLLYMLTDAPDSRRLVHAFALFLIVSASASFFSLPTISGALQRLLWAIGFTWLAYLGSDVTRSQMESHSIASA